MNDGNSIQKGGAAYVNFDPASLSTKKTNWLERRLTTPKQASANLENFSNAIQYLKDKYNIPEENLKTMRSVAKLAHYQRNSRGEKDAEGKKAEVD